MRIGVLGLQGDYAAHRAALRRAAAAEGLDVTVDLVRRPAELDGLSGLVLPGGESTTLLKLLAHEKLDDGIKRFAGDGGVVFGTCAGAILLSREVTHPEQSSLGLLDARIERNAYGRQVDSFIAGLDTAPAGAACLGDATLPGVFIRAPRFIRVGPGVEVLAREEGHPALVREGRVLAATFHPELTDDSRVHAWFLRQAAEARRTT